MLVTLYVGNEPWRFVDLSDPNTPRIAMPIKCQKVKWKESHFPFDDLLHMAEFERVLWTPLPGLCLDQRIIIFICKDPRVKINEARELTWS